jgi:putative heme-binding domain-containing protein
MFGTTFSWFRVFVLTHHWLCQSPAARAYNPRMKRSFQVLVCLTLAASPRLAAAQTRAVAPRPLGAAISTDIAAGRRIFDAQCAWCHGAGGTGGTGPDLRRATLRHAANDAALVQIVRNGIPGTEMPSFAIALTDNMAWQTAAYVRSLGRTRAAPAAGDAQRGVQLYESSGCGSCHVLGGRGGILGPELTAIGALRGAPYLRDALVKPAAAHPPGYLVVRAVSASGSEIRGIRVNEDVFWIHIRDASGIVHTLEKSELQAIERELDASLMPSYAARLKDAELDDLVAYLSTLRGGK